MPRSIEIRIVRRIPEFLGNLILAFLCAVLLILEDQLHLVLFVLLCCGVSTTILRIYLEELGALQPQRVPTPLNNNPLNNN